MKRVRCPHEAYRWLVDRFGGAALLAALLMAGLATWWLLSGWRAPEPGTWGHAALSLVLGTILVASIVLGRRERKRLERLERERQRRRAVADAETQALMAEARRLLPYARAGYARRRAENDRRTSDP